MAATLQLSVTNGNNAASDGVTGIDLISAEDRKSVV